MNETEADRNSSKRTSPEDKVETNKLFKVFLGGIPRTMDEEELFSIFRKYKPTGAMVMREMSTKRSRGFAFITFPSQKDMDRAIADLHNTRMNGRLVTVTKARPFERPKDRSPDGRWDSPPPRRPHRRHEYEERYHSSRRGYQEHHYRSDISSIHPSYRSMRDNFDDPYSSRRGNDYGGGGGGGGYSNRRFERRRSSSERAPYYEDRRDWRHPSLNHHEVRRQRWRSRERTNDGNHGYSENHRRRDYSPPPPDRSPRGHPSARHRGEGRRPDHYERD
eukprot:g1312.t1